MGLDIAAISNVKFVTLAEAEDLEKEGIDVSSAWINDAFEHQAHDYLDHTVDDSGCGLKYIHNGEGIAFRAGSYSTYNAFRRYLCVAVNGMTAEQLWESGDDTLPFFHLINFSDCEGVIGATVSEELYRDFVKYKELFSVFIEQQQEEDQQNHQWMKRVYDDFTKGFDVARQEGLLIFG